MHYNKWRDGVGGGGPSFPWGWQCKKSHQENERQALNHFSLCSQQTMSWWTSFIGKWRNSNL